MATRYRTDGSWLDWTPEGGTQASDDSERARLAAAAYVERVRPDLFTVTVSGADTLVTYDPDAAVVHGARLLAARLHARRSTPQGLASFGEFGPAGILRLDPDVERLLGVGRSATPAIG